MIEITCRGMEGQFEPVRLAVEVTSNVLSETNEIVLGLSNLSCCF